MLDIYSTLEVTLRYDSVAFQCKYVLERFVDLSTSELGKAGMGHIFV